MTNVKFKCSLMKTYQRMKRYTNVLFAAFIAATTLFASCASTKQQKDDEYYFDKYLKTGKRKWEKIAVPKAFAEMPTRIPRIKPAGLDSKKAALVIMKGPSEDTLLRYLRNKNIVDCDSLSDDEEMDPWQFRRIITHDEAMMKALPDGVRKDLADLVLTENKDIFWAKALLDNEELAHRISMGSFSPHALHMFMATTGDTTIVGRAARLMTYDMAVKYNLTSFRPEEKPKSATKSAGKTKKGGSKKAAQKKTKKK